MQIMSDFDVAHVVPTSAWTEDQHANMLEFTWVGRWKSMDIRSRMCVKGFKHWTKDLDDTFYTTPVLMILKGATRVCTQYAVAHLYI